MIASRFRRRWHVAFLALGTVTIILQALGWEMLAGIPALLALLCLVKAEP